MFDFIFFPSLLTKKKFSFFQKSEDFIEEIKFFIELKNPLQSELTPEQKKLIAKKYPLINH